MHWLYLLLAILCEVSATTSMKLSEGFTRPIWSTVMTVGYIASFIFITFALKRIDLGPAYAIWAGAGTAAAAIIGTAAFGEPLTWLKVAGVALVVAGVVVLRLGGAH